MFTINDDLSIYVTRGDTVFFTVTAEENGRPYKFREGDILRLKITEKKDAESVLFQKTFILEEEAEKVNVHLNGDETRFGDVISKPTDYWYEIELNPFTKPQTIIGYDEDGAKIFRLFPEGDDFEYVEPEDVPVVDAELSLTSERPVQNQAVSRALIQYEERVAEAQERINTTADAAEQRVETFAEETVEETKTSLGTVADSAVERVHTEGEKYLASTEENARRAESAANKAEAVSGGEFLPKTGGTLENASVTMLILSNTASDSVMQGFKANGEIKGYIGFGNNGPVFKETSSSASKRFLHEGNYKNFCDLDPIINGTTPVGKANDADTVDGKHASDFQKTMAVAVDASTNTLKSLKDLVPYSGKARFVYLTGIPSDFPTNLETPTSSGYLSVEVNKVGSLIYYNINAVKPNGTPFNITGYYTSGTFFWEKDANSAEVLPLDGSVPMSGAFSFNGGHSKLEGTSAYTLLTTRSNLSDGTIRRNLVFRNHTHSSGDIGSCLQIHDYTSEGTKAYNILHEANMKHFVLPLTGSVPMSGDLKVNTNKLIGRHLEGYGSDGVNNLYLNYYSQNAEIYAYSGGTGGKLLHTGNSAKVVVSSTPLTAEGSIRVW